MLPGTRNQHNGIRFCDGKAIRRYGAVGLFLLGLVFCLQAAGIAGGLSAVINRIDTDDLPRVRCYVSVTADTGESVLGLTKDRFTIREGESDVPLLECRSIARGEERTAVVLAVDHSGSMYGKPARAARAATSVFTERLTNQDLLAVLPFADTVEPGELLTDRATALRPLQTVVSGGKTALYDAVLQGIQLLEDADSDRKAVVALSDGEDTASTATPEECITAARDSGVIIYTISLGRRVNEDIQQRLAEQTGGRHFTTDAPEDLTAIYRRIASQLTTEYAVTFTTPRPEALGFHHVELTVADRGAYDSVKADYLIIGQETELSAGMDTDMMLCLGIAGGILINAVLALLVLRRRRRPWGMMP